MKYIEKTFGVKVLEKAVVFFSLIAIVISGLMISSFYRYSRVDRLDIQAVIKRNGDVDITETYEYKFRGKYNGIFRNFDLGNDKLIINEITTRDDKRNIVTYDNSIMATEGTYYLDNNGNLKIYSKSKNERKKVTIKYTVRHAAEKYPESSVFYWQFYQLVKGDKIKGGSIAISLDSASSFNGFGISSYEFYGGNSPKILKENEVIKCNFKEITSSLGVLAKFDKEYMDSNIVEKSYPLDIDADSPINDTVKRGGIAVDGWIVSAIIFILVVISHGHNIYLALTGRVDEVRFGNSRGFDDFGDSDFGGGSSSGGSSSSGGF